MTRRKQQILDLLEKSGYIDVDVYKIAKTIPSIPEQMQNPTEYSQRIRSLYQTGLTDEQLDRLAVAVIMKDADIQDVKSFDQLYSDMKRTSRY
jgi:hypothetical protein